MNVLCTTPEDRAPEGELIKEIFGFVVVKYGFVRIVGVIVDPLETVQKYYACKNEYPSDAITTLSL